MHSTEVAGAPTPAELLYDMTTRTDEEMTRILEQTVAIVIPSLNTDGTGMVANWVKETAGTQFEGVGLPWLYHRYIEVNRAAERFEHEGRVYDAGTHVVSLAQPKRGVIRWLLGRTFYPSTPGSGTALPSHPTTWRPTVLRNSWAWK